MGSMALQARVCGAVQGRASVWQWPLGQGVERHRWPSVPAIVRPGDSWRHPQWARRPTGCVAWKRVVITVFHQIKSLGGQQKQSNDPRNNQHDPRYANYWAPLTRRRHILPHPAQPWHPNHWAPEMRKPHQKEHWPQRPTESSDLTQHAEGRTGDSPGPRKETATRRNVTQGVLYVRPNSPPPLSPI